MVVGSAAHRASLRRLRERLAALPGVEAAVLDFDRGSPLGAYAVHPEDRAAFEDAFPLNAKGASSGYFDVMGATLVRGRAFTSNEVRPRDRSLEVPVIIRDDLARRLWSGADPLGRRLRASSDSINGPRTLVVVGVVDYRQPKRATIRKASGYSCRRTPRDRPRP